MEQQYQDFLNLIPEESKHFVAELDSFLTEQKCKRTIKPSAKGYLVTYTRPRSGKSLLNFVFRKNCVKVRIYAAHVSNYEAVIETFPEETKRQIANALDCKKLTGKTCSPTCRAGYAFAMDGVKYKKCKNMAFMPELCEANNPIVREMIEKELSFTEE